jgi:hypothetical protein
MFNKMSPVIYFLNLQIRFWFKGRTSVLECEALQI